MTTETEKLMENVAEVRAFLETFKEKDHTPLKEEVERLSAQITESVRASKRAALLRQVESGTQGARVLSGKYRGFDEFDLMVSREVLRIGERGGTNGRSPIDPRMSAEWRTNLGELGPTCTSPSDAPWTPLRRALVTSSPSPERPARCGGTCIWPHR